MNKIYTLGYHYDNVIKVVKTSVRIHEAYKYVIKNNLSNELPYHGIRHILNVFKAVNDLSLNGLSDIEKEALYIAVLFHDYGHTAGIYDDEYNVKFAIDEFKFFVGRLNYQLEPKDKYYDELVNQVIDNIKATQYPYVIPKEELTRSQKLIRTADLIQVIYGNVITDYVLPLYSEMIVSKDKDMDLITFIDGCIDFWTKIEFPINDIYCELIKENTIIEFQKYKEILI